MAGRFLLFFCLRGLINFPNAFLPPSVRVSSSLDWVGSSRLCGLWFRFGGIRYAARLNQRRASPLLVFIRPKAQVNYLALYGFLRQFLILEISEPLAKFLDDAGFWSSGPADGMNVR